MKQKHLAIIILTMFLSSCAYDGGEQGTIAELDRMQMELKDADVDDGLDKAMAGYQKFLEETPESQLTPEAIRRLADLKVEKEYGAVLDESDLGREPVEDIQAPEVETKALSGIDASVGQEGKQKTGDAKSSSVVADNRESENEFEKRATESQKIYTAKNDQLQLPKGEAGADLKNTNADEAIRLYNQLLEKYPLYERNDQVLYQLSRAYEETGQVDKAMMIMDRLVKQFPNSRYNDEVHFRRGEYYFTRKKYLDAEEAYEEVLKMGVGTVYYERALYKKGWTFYKQELYDEALKEYFELLDYKVSIGYDFEQTADDIEKKRIDDTFRVVSLSFSNLGGSDTVKDFFVKSGARDYEYYVYKELAEFYFNKRRYSDAAATYNMFAEENPFHRKSPHFNMRVIEIYMKGGFPRLVIEAKKQYASTYGLEAEYWNYFNQAEYPEVLGYLKTNLTDLANHYHSLYQSKKFKKDKPQNFLEATHWYKEFLKSFPKDEQSPAINYQLADLYLENKDFDLAAIEYERSAYDYPVNDNSQKAAYATVYSYREYLKQAPVSQLKNVKRDIIRTSLRLVDTFPAHEKATVVLGAATDDLFEMRDFALAIKTGRRLIDEYPNADQKIRRGAWLVVAHASYEIEIYNDAEQAYIEVLALTASDDKSRVHLVDNLAASIYKQGEKAREEENYREAVRHFLRIADVAPASKIRPSAEYDAAAVLIQIMDLEQAITVLLAFRADYPQHEFQRDVTKKIAFSYKELGKYSLAAKEYERVAVEAGEEEELVREAMLQAAELYEQAKDVDNSLRVYKQFVVKFPKPLEFALETYYKIAMIYKSQNDMYQYRETLQHIIKTDAQSGEERTDRTRYLAAQSSLVIIEPQFDEYVSIRLVKPFKKSLAKKQKSMKSLVAKYTKLVDYEVADVTAASTYYIAEIYYNFNRSLMESEKPEGLNELELEEFSLMVEEQAFPFEEKSIQVHEKNIELLALGIHSSWIDRSIEKLARLLPATYNKPEEAISFIAKIDNYIYFSPRYVREDASTGYVTTLEFFRYRSQIAPVDHHNNRLPDDSVTEKGVMQGGAAAGDTSSPASNGEAVPEQKTPSVVPLTVEPTMSVDSQDQAGQQEVVEAPSSTDGEMAQGKEDVPAGDSVQQDAIGQDIPGEPATVTGEQAVESTPGPTHVNAEQTVPSEADASQEPAQQEQESVEEPPQVGVTEEPTTEAEINISPANVTPEGAVATEPVGTSGVTGPGVETGNITDTPEAVNPNTDGQVESEAPQENGATESQPEALKQEAVSTVPISETTESNSKVESGATPGTAPGNTEEVITQEAEVIEETVENSQALITEPAAPKEEVVTTEAVVDSVESIQTESASSAAPVNMPSTNEVTDGSVTDEQATNVNEPVEGETEQVKQEEQSEQAVVPEENVEASSGSDNETQN